MVIAVLGYKIFSVDDFIELQNGIFVIFLHVIRITQLVKIGVIPFAFFTFVFF